MSSLTTIAVPGAPKAIGPYAQGIVANGFLFTAGQVPLNPDTMTLVEGDIAAQTERIFDNLEAIVTGAGTTLGRTVKATVYLMDMADFAAMNAVFEKRFEGHRPARSTVQVSRLPAAARVEIDLIVAL
ncbi:MAG: hypothetical protein JNK60_15065 [Acidobacteria bacterium]|nr:hypothetical protein [Acidobacteriota bacterium]